MENVTNYLELLAIGALFGLYYAVATVIAPQICAALFKTKYTTLTAKEKASLDLDVVSGVNGLAAFLFAAWILIRYDFSADYLGTDLFQVRVLCIVQAAYFISVNAPKSQFGKNVEKSSAVNAKILDYIFGKFVWPIYQTFSEDFGPAQKVAPGAMLPYWGVWGGFYGFAHGILTSLDLALLFRGSAANSPGLFIVHHLSCLLAYYAALVLGLCQFHLVLRTINEMSTVFYNGRSVLSTLKMKGSRIYVVNGLLFMATFFIARILMIPLQYYTWNSIPVEDFLKYNPYVSLIFYVASVPVDILNVYWFSLVFRGFLKYCFKERKSQETGKNE